MKPGTGMYARSLNSSTWWTRTDKRVSVSVIDEGWWGEYRGVFSKPDLRRDRV